METKRSLFFKGILIALIIAVVVRQYITYRVAPDLDVQQLSLTTLDGTPVDLDSYKGKALFLNFYATWCPPCNAEMPALEEMKQILGTEQMVYLAISDEDPRKIESFKQKHGSSFAFVRSSIPLGEFGVNTIPTTFILNADNKVVLDEVGGLNWSSERIINKIRDKADLQ